MFNRYSLWTAAMSSVGPYLYFVIVALGLNPVVRAAEGPPPAPVVVAKAEDRQMAPTAWYSGTVVSRHEAKVPAEVAGRLISVAEVGTRVEKGNTIAKLDTDLTELERDEYRAEVERVTAQLTFLAQEVIRLQRLAQANNAAQTLLEETVARRDATRSELAAGRARLAQAELRLERSEVKAPFRGVIVERIANAGEWVDSGGPVVRVMDAHNLEIQAKVPLSVVPYLRVGDPVAAKAQTAETRATVHSIVPVGDTLSRLVDMRLSFEEPQWSHGQAVRVAVPTAPVRQVIAVPRDALVLRRDGAAVFRVVDNGTAERVSVTTGVASGAWIEVQGGVQPGDQVIVRGGERMRPGQQVRIIGDGFQL